MYEDQASEVAAALCTYEEVREMGSGEGWKRMVLEMQNRAKLQRELVENAMDTLLLGPENEVARENYRHQKTVFLGYEYAAALYREIRENAITAKSLDRKSIK